MATLPADWADAAVTITTGFEASGNPYLAVTGDFDGMGISCGALQWNIGQGSLQPMVISVGEATALAAMPTLGREMWTAAHAKIPEGLRIVRTWQTGTKLGSVAKRELIALMGTPEMRAAQDKKIAKVASEAYADAKAWVSKSTVTGGEVTKRQFCWFFDLRTQNGGLKGLTPEDVADFIGEMTANKADDVICEFLATRPDTSGHTRDGKKNAKLWLDVATIEQMELLCMSYLRSEMAVPKWQVVVLNRKGTIAMGQGWVNSKHRQLTVLQP